MFNYRVNVPEKFIQGNRLLTLKFHVYFVLLKYMFRGNL